MIKPINPLRKSFAKQFRRNGVGDIREDIKLGRINEKELKRRVDYIKKIHKQILGVKSSK